MGMVPHTQKHNRAAGRRAVGLVQPSLVTHTRLQVVHKFATAGTSSAEPWRRPPALRKRNPASGARRAADSGEVGFEGFFL